MRFTKEDISGLVKDNLACLTDGYIYGDFVAIEDGDSYATGYVFDHDEDWVILTEVFDKNVNPIKIHAPYEKKRYIIYSSSDIVQN